MSKTKHLGSTLLILALAACASAPSAPPATYPFMGRQLTLQELRGLAYDKGDDRARIELGRIYELGLHTQADDAEARKFYDLAANDGDLGAELYLAHLLMYNYGDYASAILWYQKADAQGSPDADAMLWYIYEKGLYGMHNDQKAGYYFDKASRSQRGLFTAFGLTMMDAIEKQKYYPKSAVLASHRGIVYVGFDYTGGGKATNVMVARSSGFADLDTAAMNAVKDAALPEITDGLRDIVKGTTHYVFPFSFGFSAY